MWSTESLRTATKWTLWWNSFLNLSKCWNLKAQEKERQCLHLLLWLFSVIFLNQQLYHEHLIFSCIYSNIPSLRVCVCNGRHIYTAHTVQYAYCSFRYSTHIPHTHTHTYTHIWLFHSSRGVLGGWSLNRKTETERGVLQRDSSLSLYFGPMSGCSVGWEWKASIVCFISHRHTDIDTHGHTHGHTLIHAQSNSHTFKHLLKHIGPYKFTHSYTHRQIVHTHTHTHTSCSSNPLTQLFSNENLFPFIWKHYCSSQTHHCYHGDTSTTKCFSLQMKSWFLFIDFIQNSHQKLNYNTKDMKYTDTDLAKKNNIYSTVFSLRQEVFTHARLR